MSTTTSEDHGRATGQWGRVAPLLVLAVLAILSPWMARTAPAERVGVLLSLAAIIEVADGFRRTGSAAQRAAWFSGAITLAMGVLLINAPWVTGAGLILVLAGWFALDALRYIVAAVRQVRAGHTMWPSLLAMLGNLAVVLILLSLRGRGAAWLISVAGALRILGTAWNIRTASRFTEADSGRTVLDDLGLAQHPDAAALGARLEQEELRRAPVDRGWVAGFIATLFAIHLGRMGLDQSALGLLSPVLAVVGDLIVSLLVAFVLIVPLSLVLRKITRGVERRLWIWCLAAPEGARRRARRVVRAVLTRRLRFSIRLRQARYSFGAALSRGLQIGLPVAAIIAATVPVWGMSWYFDTENWAAGVWNSWAEARTDTWREAMTDAQPEREAADAFAVHPDGVADGADFSFVVIGDTGEGDASQHVLRDAYLDVVRKAEVKFVVLSSDVVYPVGAMKDYETKFWLPFKGTRQPLYAIPGNHDWYDALEAFNATFLRPEAARIAMRARVEADNHLTSTTDRRIDDLIAEASRLRREYGVPTQWQRAPFFEVQTDRFALIAVDTGVAKTLDPAEWTWLRAALARARGKMTMAVLGHPFYAGGLDMVGGNAGFAALRQALIEAGVSIVMAGDTHDLEYYPERSPGAGRTVYHVVNGGGGAYLSFGTALEWPASPPTPDWAYYPATAQVSAKIDATTPWWKWPAWWWTRAYHAWPFSVEWMSAAFDVNAAPFYQSFVEVIVEPSAGRVRLWPHGVHGRLRWSDLQTSGGLRPSDVAPDAPVEWVIAMPPR